MRPLLLSSMAFINVGSLCQQVLFFVSGGNLSLLLIPIPITYLFFLVNNRSSKLYVVHSNTSWACSWSSEKASLHMSLDSASTEKDIEAHIAYLTMLHLLTLIFPLLLFGDKSSLSNTMSINIFLCRRRIYILTN